MNTHGPHTETEHTKHITSTYFLLSNCSCNCERSQNCIEYSFQFNCSVLRCDRVSLAVSPSHTRLVIKYTLLTSCVTDKIPQLIKAMNRCMNGNESFVLETRVLVVADETATSRFERHWGLLYSRFKSKFVALEACLIS